MKINWFTLIAQVINFLILVWLLKRYLYKPILTAVDEREKKIKDQLEDAKSEKENAKKEQDEFNKKNETFEQQKKELMEKTIAETNEERKKLLENARKEANELSSKIEEESKKSQQNLNQEIALKTEQEVFAITKKALIDLASSNIEEQTINVFIKRLKELKEEEKKKFISAFTSTSSIICTSSAFELTNNLKTEIEKSVNDILGLTAQFKFIVVPKLISGIELDANGYKLAWSISEYLNSLEKNIFGMSSESSETTVEKK